MSLDGTKTQESKGLCWRISSEQKIPIFCKAADIELPEAAGVFKNTADGETGHAFGHLEFLEKGGAGDPATGLNIGETEDNLKAAASG